MPAPKGRSKSAKKQSPLELAKEEIAKKQTLIDNLTKELNEIKEAISEEEAERQKLTRKLHMILPEILAHRDRDRFPVEPVSDPIGESLTVDIDAEYIREMIYALVEDLHFRQNKKTLIEERLEELENRITEQQKNYQSIRRKNLACMEGIEEALQSSSGIEMKMIINKLKQNLLIEEPIRSRPPSAKLFQLTQLPPEDPCLPDPAIEVLRRMETINFDLPRPVRKQPGDTHIRFMVPEIKEVICSELSVEHSLRGDWRHFAQLVGVSTQTIQFWRRLNICNPMQQVLTYWRDHPHATVRQLHRLLLSPQIRAVVLAKLVSDFYHID